MRLRLFAVVLLACVAGPVAPGGAWAQVPPPPPTLTSASSSSIAAPTAWACTRKTLLEDLPCSVEGTTAAQAPSREAGKKEQRLARLFGEALCRTLARAGAADEDAGLLAVCASRVAMATKKCGGDGSRPLLDGEGRFNAGHARCYGALAGVVREMDALTETASSCCACVADRCKGDADRCMEKMAAGAKPDAASQCLTSTCSAECAALHLAPRKP